MKICPKSRRRTFNAHTPNISSIHPVPLVTPNPTFIDTKPPQPALTPQRDKTENPRVGGSTPSLATNKYKGLGFDAEALFMFECTFRAHVSEKAADQA